MNHNARSGGIIMTYIRVFFNMKVCCLFSLESPHRGDSNENTQYTTFSIKAEKTQNYPKSTAMGFFQGTQERI